MMLLATAGGSRDPIPPETRRLAGLLAREKTGEILAHLQRRPFQSASEIARLETIHVATAQRYLKEMAEAGLVSVRYREGAARPTEEYWLNDPQITIQIDLHEMTTQADDLEDAAKRLVVHDRVPANVVYDTNPATGAVEGLLVLSNEPPRTVDQRIRVTPAVGRFIGHLPATQGEGRTVWEIMESAALNRRDLPEVLAAVHRFSADAPQGDHAQAGSARAPDPELDRLFVALGAHTGRLVADAPTVPIMEVTTLPGPTHGAGSDRTNPNNRTDPSGPSARSDDPPNEQAPPIPKETRA